MPRKPPTPPQPPTEREAPSQVAEEVEETIDEVVVASLDEPMEGEGLPQALPLPDEVETFEAASEGVPAEVPSFSETEAAEGPGLVRAAPRSVSELHLKGILESLVFVSDKPISTSDLARLARADAKDVRRLLSELREEYRPRGIQLDEIASGWQFRSSAANAPFVRELLQARPVRLTRAQVETLAIIAYRQPVTRPEVDDIRGVDSGSAVKVLLERELIRMLGRKEEVGRPVLYGTTSVFLEFFGLKSLRDLPTLREFTELTPESEATLVRELGDAGAPAPESTVADAAPAGTGEATDETAGPTVAAAEQESPIPEEADPPVRGEVDDPAREAAATTSPEAEVAAEPAGAGPSTDS